MNNNEKNGDQPIATESLEAIVVKVILADMTLHDGWASLDSSEQQQLRQLWEDAVRDALENDPPARSDIQLVMTMPPAESWSEKV
jgi:hypothetical protein